MQLIFLRSMWDIFRRFYYSFVNNFFVLVAFLQQDGVLLETVGVSWISWGMVWETVVFWRLGVLRDSSERHYKMEEN